MKCPVCDEIMYRREEIFQHSAFYNRMHLHCLNSNCLAKKEINYTAHISILIDSDPIWGGGRLCYEYHLPFKDCGKWYHLIGKQESFSGTILRTNDDPRPLMVVDFLYIDPNEDMHHDAWKTFRRLKNLLVFS